MQKVALAFCFLFAPFGVHGQTAGGTDAAQPANSPSGTSKDRLFYTLPNFLTLENVGQAPPLSAAEKFRVTARSTLDPAQFFWHGAQAALGQAQNSDGGYGQGASGYAKRYAADSADGIIENFAVQAVLPSLLHQDPRYFQSAKGGFRRRTVYALSCIFVTRSDSGQRQFNLSEILGSATAAGISTFTYHPKGDRNISNAISVWETQVGFDALGNVVKEFWPDIRRKLHK